MVSDKAGNSETVNVTIKIDTTPPDTNKITAPLTNLTGQSAISETTYIFKNVRYKKFRIKIFKY